MNKGKDGSTIRDREDNIVMTTVNRIFLAEATTPTVLYKLWLPKNACEWTRTVSRQLGSVKTLWYHLRQKKNHNLVSTAVTMTCTSSAAIQFSSIQLYLYSICHNQKSKDPNKQQSQDPKSPFSQNKTLRRTRLIWGLLSIDGWMGDTKENNKTKTFLTLPLMLHGTFEIVLIF